MLKAKNIQKIVSIIFFLWSIFYFLKVWLENYQLKFNLDLFDGSLRLISGLYASNNFIAYKDFSFVYPPGLVILSQIFHINSYSYYQIFALIFLTITIIFVWFLAIKAKSLFFISSLIFILSLNINLLSDPFIEILWLFLIALIYFFLKGNNNRYLIFIYFIEIAILFLKWERIIITLLLLNIYLAASFVLRKVDKKIINLILISFCSIFTSIFLFYLYCSFEKIDIKNALYFIIIVPIKILPFRKLPLPQINLIHNFHAQIIYFCFFILAFLLIYLILFLKNSKQNIIDFLDNNSYLVLFFVVLFPVLIYSLGRSDLGHTFPLFFTLLLIILLINLSNKRIIPIVFLSLIYMFLYFNIFKNTFYFLPNTVYINKVNSDLTSCKLLIKNKNYKTIFVGRSLYTNYIINYAYLYLINPKIKPASQYISDEPGLQNNCYDGEKIAQELKIAKKPMLVFLDNYPQWKEPNNSSNMNSCGNIENWVNKNKFERIGICSVQDRKFEVRIYK